MKVEIITPEELFYQVKYLVRHYNFILATHILTNPFLSVLKNADPYVKRFSEIYLDGNKDKINYYAVRELWNSGYDKIWFVNNLHTKVMVFGDPEKPKYVFVGSANYSERAIATNIETIVLIENPTKAVVSQLRNKLLDVLRRERRSPR